MAVPSITSIVMFGVKPLAGLNLTDNGPDELSWLRAILIAFSLVDYIATAAIACTPIVPTSS